MFTFLNPTAVFSNALNKDKNSINIRASLYNKILHKLNNQWEKDRSYSHISVYFNDELERIVLHITDERLSNIIYHALKSGIEISSKYQNLKFITVDKMEKAVFAVYSGRMHERTPRDIFENLISLTDNFKNMIDISGENLYINYPFLYLLTKTNHWLTALFMSLTFEPVTLSQNDIHVILSRVLNYMEYSNSYEDLKNTITYSNASFYEWLRKGIYIKSKRECSSNIPFELEINIIRYVLDNNYIKDIHDIFIYGEDILSFNNYNRYNTAFIIDEKIFQESVKQIKENDDFIVYEDNKSYTFAKVKNDQDFDFITSNLKELEDLILNSYSVLISNTIGKYIFFAKNQKNTLKSTLRSCYETENNLITLIKTLDDWGRSQNKLNKFWFYKDTDFLTVLLQNKLDCFPLLKDPLVISFNRAKNSQPFNYKYVLLLVIKEYLMYNQINVKDIYLCEFVKILHPNFMEALFEFITEGIVNITPQDKTFNGLDVTQVEFVENLPLKDTTLLSRVTFFKDYTPSNKLNSLLKSVKEKNIADGCLDLEECLSYIDSTEISKTSLKNIFANSNLKGNYCLTPAKVIISKNITKSGNYKIIGVIWNHGRLKNAYEVIKSKTLTTKEVYLFINKVLETNLLYDQSVLTSSATNNQLLYSLDYNIPILYEPSMKYTQYNSNISNPKEYYLAFLDLLIKEAEFEINYDIFEYNQLVTNRRTNYKTQVHQFLTSVLEMKKCSLHNHWQLKGELCPICKKIFKPLIIDSYKKNALYQDKIATFYECMRHILYSMDSDLRFVKHLDDIRVGLENDIYKDFVGIKPIKLILNPNGTIATCLLLSETNFNNVIPLNSFKNIQRLKVILVMYKKLLPLILNKSFICTSRKIFETMIMHKDFKGEILIPNLALLESSVILSDNQALKESKAKKTLEIFASYLLNYINSDEYLAKVLFLGIKKFVAIVEDIKAYKFNEDLIKNVIDTYKNFCFTHMQPFDTSRSICPTCAEDGINDKQIIFKDKEYFTKLSSGKSSFDGGEADIYPYDETNVQKIFQPHVDLAFKSKILAKAMTKNHLIEDFNNTHTDIRIISASTLLYMKEGTGITLKGFVQEYVKDSYKISNLKDKEFVREHGYTRKDVVEILIKVCKGIEFIHSIGGFIGDLNGGNILIRGTDVFIIDIDGMSFDDVKNCMYTNMYIYPPSAESGNITAYDDWYSLAVQAFYYLTYSHPFRGISENTKVPANETERMKQGLSALGEHHIVPPSISIGWDFLPEKLLKYFLDTFEGKRRESMLELLQAYLTHLKKFENLFVAKTYKYKVKTIISPDVYIDVDFNLVFKERILLNIEGYDTLSTNNHGILVVIGNWSYFFDIKTEKEYRINKYYTNGAIEITPNSVYYTSQNKSELFADEFVPETGMIKTHNIRKASNYKILKLTVDEGHKFVFVEDNTNNNTYDLYCNSTKVYSISKHLFDNQLSIGIAYDELSKKRLVIFRQPNVTRGVIIERNTEQVTEFVLQKPISDSISFYGNTIYYVGNGNIFFYNVNTGTFKNIECEYAKKDSMIYRFDNKFVIINEATAHIYEKS